MSKLMFLVHFNDVTKSSGIIEKVITQSKYMNKEGMLYKTFILYDKDQRKEVSVYNKYDFINFVPINFYKIDDNKIKKVFLIENIYKEYDKICSREKGNYDYIYMRFNPLFHGFIKFVKKYPKKFIFEHNSIEREEYKSNKSISYLTSKLFDKKLRKYAFGYIAVTDQIYSYQQKLYKNIKGISLSNGIEVSKYPLRKVPKYDGQNINMIFIGNIRYWHGLERMFKSISNYNGSKDVKLNIYGPINEKDSLTKELQELNIEKNVVFHGFKTKSELDDIFNNAHIAVGSLGCYKKNVDYACTLKNREYFSRGIPVIFSEIDQDIPMKYNKKYFYKVANDDSIFELEDIIDYIDQIYKGNIKELSQNIREYAFENMDYQIKVKKLKKYIEMQEKTNS